MIISTSDYFITLFCISFCKKNKIPCPGVSHSTGGLSHHQRNRTAEEMESFKMPSYISTPNSFLSWQLATIVTSIWTVSSACLVHKKHFVVSEKERNTVFYAQAKERNTVLYLLLRQQSVSYAQKTVFLSFLSFAETTKCFLYIENSVSFFYQDNKVFLVHRKQCFFLLPSQQSVSSAQETVFLSFALTTKCFLCIENSVSFFCQDNKVFLVYREHYFFPLHRQQNVYSTQKTVFLSFP